MIAALHHIEEGMAFHLELRGLPLDLILRILVGVADVNDVAGLHRKSVGKRGIRQGFGGIRRKAAVRQIAKNQRHGEREAAFLQWWFVGGRNRTLADLIAARDLDFLLCRERPSI